MSNFICKECGIECIDTERGYITGCEHYPPEVSPTSDELKALFEANADRRTLVLRPTFMRTSND